MGKNPKSTVTRSHWSVKENAIVRSAVKNAGTHRGSQVELAQTLKAQLPGRTEAAIAHRINRYLNNHITLTDGRLMGNYTPVNKAEQRTVPVMRTARTEQKTPVDIMSSLGIDFKNPPKGITIIFIQ
jgi:hypothetical protein